MIIYKTPQEIELIRESSLMVSKTLATLAPLIKPGAIPLDLDKKAEEFIRDNESIPGFLGLYDFPNTLCISINNQLVHGIPNKEPLKDGDIVSIDCGVIKNEYWGDHAYTFLVGDVSEEKRKLVEVTKECLNIGIEKFKIGNRIGDVGYHIQNYAESHGYGVVRELAGHGLGKDIHEDPDINNYGKRGQGKMIKNGLVVAIEPMITMGDRKIFQESDKWTISTSDGSPSAHFEHNVSILNGKTEILSDFSIIENAIH